ncbi:PIN domain-containing protein [Pyrococcus kukulkanii]|uniref:PIN domain-containing protein n=1 Tax=Pyrococcus kukulkanii TaxID=1609559 RepID=UPI000AEC57E2|nr:PIN domain-containing protein [Pyrococcus kukulkanii]
METERLFGRTGKFRVKKMFMQERERFDSVFKYLSEFILENIELGIIELPPPNKEILNEAVTLSKEFGLLPNDALIAAACKFCGISKIATFDKGFENVPFLEVLYQAQ